MEGSLLLLLLLLTYALIDAEVQNACCVLEDGIRTVLGDMKMHHAVAWRWQD
jgi:hypothetical protein